MDHRLRWLVVGLAACVISVPLIAQRPAADPTGGGLGDLSRLSHAKSRSISPENFTGEKGKGGMATTGTGERAARDLGQGWKISPSVRIKAGETFVLGEDEYTKTDSSQRDIQMSQPVYEALKAQGILIRYMNYAGWGDGLRITVGTDDEIDAFLTCLKTI